MQYPPNRYKNNIFLDVSIRHKGNYPETQIYPAKNELALKYVYARSNRYNNQNEPYME